MSTKQVTIVMYHYVRPVFQSAYPRIKGLEVDNFAAQLAYLKKHYNPISMEHLIGAVHDRQELPPNACLLTFDDGYTDHFRYALPLLVENKLQGSFFPPAQAITENKVLDVNKLHFILAAVPDTDLLLKEVFGQLSVLRPHFLLPSDDALFSKLAVASALDTKEVIFIKRLLQVELPLEARKKITDQLFKKFITEDEAEFSRELYMNVQQLQTLLSAGMHIGSHGFSHEWLGTLPENQQRIDVVKSLNFLAMLGVDMQKWTMTYPYGSFNDSLLTILEEKKCKLAFKSLPPDVANITDSTKFLLPRIDTVDLAFGR